MGVAAIALGVLGSLASVAGTVVGAEAQSANASYQAQVAANNAKIAQQNARWTMQAGEQKANNEGQKTRAEVGSIKAAQAARNIDVNSGSAVDVRSSASELGELNQLTIRSNSSRDAYAYSVQAMNDQAQSTLDENESSQAMTAGMIGAAGSLLGGASSTVGDYMKFNAAGAFG